jgi:hypothetical protein
MATMIKKSVRIKIISMGNPEVGKVSQTPNQYVFFSPWISLSRAVL